MKWVAFSDSFNSSIYTNGRGKTLQREEHIVMCIYESLDDCIYHSCDTLLIYSLSLSCPLSRLFLEVLLLLVLDWEFSYKNWPQQVSVLDVLLISSDCCKSML